MRAMKELWIKKQEDICEDYRVGDLSYIDALDRLVQMGFKDKEAAELLEEVSS